MHFCTVKIVLLYFSSVFHVNYSKFSNGQNDKLNFTNNKNDTNDHTLSSNS